jgi:hypothetical protein
MIFPIRRGFKLGIAKLKKGAFGELLAWECRWGSGKRAGSAEANSIQNESNQTRESNRLNKTGLIKAIESKKLN